MNQRLPSVAADAETGRKHGSGGFGSAPLTNSRGMPT